MLGIILELSASLSICQQNVIALYGLGWIRVVGIFNTIHPPRKTKGYLHIKIVIHSRISYIWICRFFLKIFFYSCSRATEFNIYDDRTYVYIYILHVAFSLYCICYICELWEHIENIMRTIFSFLQSDIYGYTENVDIQNQYCEWKFSGDWSTIYTTFSDTYYLTNI